MLSDPDSGLQFDSDILIDLTKGVPAARELLSKTSPRSISRITWIEVLTGASPLNEGVIARLLSSFIIHEISPAIAARAIQLRRGTRLKLPDALIYATAQVHGLTLVTRNTRDFEGMDGVRIRTRFSGGRRSGCHSNAADEGARDTLRYTQTHEGCRLPDSASH